jgi:lipopolysaccharide biosynthesis glycosyltransferase
MRSVAISTTRRSDLTFHLCHWQLQPEHRNDLDGIVGEFGARVNHYAHETDPAVATRLASLPATRAFPPIVYARLMLDKILPPRVTRFVYLDCDVLVRSPIEKLLEMDIGGNAIAAAPEPGRHRLIRGNDMRGRESPFDSGEPYFNSGVILAYRPLWAQANLPGLLEKLQKSGELARLYHDQDVLNLAFRGKAMMLDPLWNLTRPHPAHRALDPHIVHYTTGLKPWNLLSLAPFATTYRHTMTRALAGRYARYRWRRWLNGRMRRRQT